MSPALAARSRIGAGPGAFARTSRFTPGSRAISVRQPRNLTHQLRAGDHEPVSPRSTGQTTSGALSAPDQALWRGFLAWSESVLALIGRDLFAATGLSRPDFEILVRLHAAPDNTLTQRDLGESLGWSPSRISHHLERMEDRDLVTRVDTGTGRLRDVRLTTRGAGEIREAIQVHATAVRNHFLGPLDQHQKQALATVFRRETDDGGLRP